MDGIGEANTIRHETLYLPSGDLVVQSAVNDDGTATLYRVNKGLLAFNSPVFATMFTLPESAAQETYDEAPIVRLTDTAENITALLFALHDPSFFSYRRYDPGLPARFTPVMRIAKKYEIDRICARVVEIILDSWPQSLEQWVCAEFEFSIMLETHRQERAGMVNGQIFEERVPEPASVIRFAREFNVSSLLPMAFYTLAGLADRSEYGTPRGKTDRVADWNLLSVLDFRHLFRSRQTLAGIVRDIFDEYNENVDLEKFRSEECRRPKFCMSKLNNIMGRWTDDVEGPLRKHELAYLTPLPNPLRLYQDLYDTHPSWQLCARCDKHLKENIRDGQQETFFVIQNFAP